LASPGPNFWKRFSLRGLFVLMTLCCLIMGMWSVFVEPFRRQAKSIATLSRSPVELTVLPAEGAAWQRWLVNTFLGEGAFVRVEGVELRGPAINDDVMNELAGLRQLQSLTLEQTQVTDAGLAVLRSMPHLQDLSLTYSLATDRSIDELKQLPRLANLKLTGTQITDASVPELAEFPALQTVFLRWTQVTDAGAEKLRELAPRCTVYHHQLAAVK
jgi:hypothetical protein